MVVGDSADNGHLMHIIHNPSRVSVQQVTNGHDEFLIIESLTDPTVRVDFRVIEAPRSADEPENAVTERTTSDQAI
jgi:hypothetical protein